MILFAGIPSEDPLRHAMEAADRLGIEHVVLNQRQTAHVDLALELSDLGSGGTLRIAGGVHRLASFSGVYARLIDAGDLPEARGAARTFAGPAFVARAHATAHLFDAWLDVSPAVVVNRPSRMGSNMSKPYQAQLIRAAGLRTPETLVTNDPEEVRAFHAEHREIIYKSASGIRSIVHGWTPELGPDLEMVKVLPTQFQGFVPGENVRVHVVGDGLFATRIVSDAVDYRYAQGEGHGIAMTPMELPPEVADACIRLAADLGLPLAGIDLKQTPDGTWYCFEVNPAPAYSYFEQQGGQPIAEAIVRLMDGSS